MIAGIEKENGLWPWPRPS